MIWRFFCRFSELGNAENAKETDEKWIFILIF